MNTILLAVCAVLIGFGILIIAVSSGFFINLLGQVQWRRVGQPPTSFSLIENNEMRRLTLCQLRLQKTSCPIRRLLSRQRGRRDERSIHKLLRRSTRRSTAANSAQPFEALISTMRTASSRGRAGWTSNSRGFSPPAPKTMQRDFGRTV
jgi:hypothetical protein